MDTQAVKHNAGIAASVVPQLILIWVLIDVWRFPMDWDNGQWVATAVELIVAEFFLLHSGVFMAGIAMEEDPSERFNAFAWLFLVYAGIIGTMSYLAGSASLFLIFGGVMLGRFVTLVIAVDEGAAHLGWRSIYGAILYVLLVPASIFLPVPELGITTSVQRLAFPEGEGVWVMEPERGIAMALAYFSIMVYLEMFKFPALQAKMQVEIDAEKAQQKKESDNS